MTESFLIGNFVHFGTPRPIEEPPVEDTKEVVAEEAKEREIQYISPTIGEITAISPLTDQQKVHYKAITQVYKYLCGSIFLLSTTKITKETIDSNLNSVEGLSALASAVLSFTGYYYSRIREAAISYFKGE